MAFFPNDIKQAPSFFLASLSSLPISLTSLTESKTGFSSSFQLYRGTSCGHQKLLLGTAAAAAAAEKEMEIFLYRLRVCLFNLFVIPPPPLVKTHTEDRRVRYGYWRCNRAWMHLDLVMGRSGRITKTYIQSLKPRVASSVYIS